MAFNIGSIANNALQLQLQQMLGNFVNAQPQVALAPQHNTANPGVPMPSAAAANAANQLHNMLMNNNNTPSATNNKDVPMELEQPGEIIGRGDSELGDKAMTKQPLGMLSNGEIIYGNMMGLPGTNQMLVQGTGQFPLMMSGMVDPNLLNMQQQLSMVQQMNRMPVAATTTPEPGTSGANQAQSKELIQCKSCTLFPPNPNAPKPTTREKPAGCRTVFVGGLPENMTEQVIHEIFERCGEITTLRLSKKNFCHIRFVFEASVESAIYLSGYRVRMGNSNDVANCGRLHVDYAQARDDQYEYECRTRQAQREQRHREKMEKERLRPLSPPQIIHYSESEAMNLGEKIKSDDKFLKACQVLCTWLERGDCNKKNSNIFYTIIQSTNSHVRRLQNEKATYEQEFKEAKDKYKKQSMTITVQFNQIDKVFTAANHKKVWDHFTKAQRKNIDLWKKSLDTSGGHSSNKESDKSDDDIMEISDDESHDSFSTKTVVNKKARFDNDKLKEENDSLRCQLRACKSEVELLKTDNKSDSDIRDKQIKVLHETIRNLQTQLLTNKARETEVNTKISELEAKLKEANVKELLLKTKIASASTSKSMRDSISSSSGKGSDCEEENTATKSSIDISSSHDDTEDNENKPVKKLKTEHEAATSQERELSINNNNNLDTKTNNNIESQRSINLVEAKIIGLASTYLAIHPPNGARLYDIWTYVNNLLPNLKLHELHDILVHYGNLFEQANISVKNNSGVHGEQKWKFAAFADEAECKSIKISSNEQ